jgi:hypothetical protein
MGIDIKILVAAHKKYEMPKDDIYFPLHVGCEGKEAIGYPGDNTGDNISVKNPAFCELTGLYWGWKNLSCDYMGLAHYRRHFTVKSRLFCKKHARMECVLSGKELRELIPKYQIILPKRRNYVIETLYSHYAHTHYAEHLDETRKIVKEKYPEYLKYFDATMKQRSGYMFNMYIMRKDLSDQYCEWLFDILFELEKRIDMPELSKFQGRFYGRVSEIIFNCWLNYQMEHNNSLKAKEIGCLHMEKINWWKKGTAFLKAKFSHKKYEGSF